MARAVTSSVLPDAIRQRRGRELQFSSYFLPFSFLPLLYTALSLACNIPSLQGVISIFRGVSQVSCFSLGRDRRTLTRLFRCLALC